MESISLPESPSLSLVARLPDCSIGSTAVRPKQKQRQQHSDFFSNHTILSTETHVAAGGAVANRSIVRPVNKTC